MRRRSTVQTILGVSLVLSAANSSDAAHRIALIEDVKVGQKISLPALSKLLRGWGFAKFRGGTEGTISYQRATYGYRAEEIHVTLCGGLVYGILGNLKGRRQTVHSSNEALKYAHGKKIIRELWSLPRPEVPRPVATWIPLFEIKVNDLGKQQVEMQFQLSPGSSDAETMLYWNRYLKGRGC